MDMYEFFMRTVFVILCIGLILYFLYVIVKLNITNIELCLILKSKYRILNELRQEMAENLAYLRHIDRLKWEAA